MIAGLVALLAIGGLVVLFIVLGIKNLYYVAQPHEVLIFSGRRHGNVSYRVVKGKAAFRFPFFETVDKVSLSNMIIEVSVQNAYSKGGIPLNVQGVANIKIPGEQPLIHNALERFLGRSRQEIKRVGRETLEANLRGVLAGLTPEEVNRDKEAFAHKLTDEAGHDLERMGLVLDTLNIQNVSDEVGYLDAVGRIQSAEIRRKAQVAEALAQADAAEVKWVNYKEAEMAKITAAIEVARKENERRINDARTKREALIAEERAEVQAAMAQAQAEIAMQEARIEQTRLRLQADIVRPAEARRDEAVAAAKADAVKIVEQGKATAQVLQELATTYRGQGTAGRDVLLMQKLVPVLEQVSGTIGQLKVDRLTVIGKGDAGSNGGDSLAGKLVATNEQVKAATGVDMAQALRTKLGVPQKPKLPRSSVPPRRAAPRSAPPANPAGKVEGWSPSTGLGQVKPPPLKR